MRIFRHVRQAKRGGRGHEPSGIAGTKPGELCLPCIACPIPGVNLPENWKDVPQEMQYELIFMIDDVANAFKQVYVLASSCH
jgi:hypothetical protein